MINVDVIFITSNKNKVKEANVIGREYGVSFNQVNLLYPEVRAETVTKVAKEGAAFVYKQLKKPAIVEDSGLFIDALNGFPGVYSAYCFKRIGNQGIIDLLARADDRCAHFISVIGYCGAKGVQAFEGRVDGTIGCAQAGDGGFGYDPIFIPDGSEKSFAQDPKYKDQVSHRRQAIAAFCCALNR